MDFGPPAPAVLCPACPKLPNCAGEPGGETAPTGDEPRSESPNRARSGGQVVPDNGFDLLAPIGANSRLLSRLRRPELGSTLSLGNSV